MDTFFIYLVAHGYAANDLCPFFINSFQQAKNFLVQNPNDLHAWANDKKSLPISQMFFHLKFDPGNQEPRYSLHLVPGCLWARLFATTVQTLNLLQWDSPYWLLDNHLYSQHLNPQKGSLCATDLVWREMSQHTWTGSFIQLPFLLFTSRIEMPAASHSWPGKLAIMLLSCLLPRGILHH